MGSNPLLQNKSKPLEICKKLKLTAIVETGTEAAASSAVSPAGFFSLAKAETETSAPINRKHVISFIFFSLNARIGSGCSSRPDYSIVVSYASCYFYYHLFIKLTGSHEIFFEKHISLPVS